MGHSGRYEKRAIANRTPQEHLNWLSEVRPKHVMARPFLMPKMAQAALDQDESLPIAQVISKAELVSPEQRRLVRKAFGGVIVDRYSSEENGMIALQCPKHERLHVLPDGSGFPMGFLGDDLGKIPAIREFG